MCALGDSHDTVMSLFGSHPVEIPVTARYFIEWKVNCVRCLVLLDYLSGLVKQYVLKPLKPLRRMVKGFILRKI